MALFRKKFTQIKNQALKQMLMDIEAYLDLHYVFRAEAKYKGLWGKIKAFFDATEAEETEKEASKERLAQPQFSYSGPHAEETFKEIAKLYPKTSFYDILMLFIQNKGNDPITVYKKAGIDRKLFSKIKNSENCIPSKKTVIAFAIALELSSDETAELLQKAGFALSNEILFDVIIDYFIRAKNYNMEEINTILFMYDLEIF